MAVDVAYMDASAGAPAYSGSDLRLAANLPLLAGAGASLGARSGVRPSGSGTDLLVQAQSSPNMTVKVNPGAIVVQGSISSTQGPYTWALDTLTNVTIAASHATLDRVDLIAVRIRDANVDTSGQRDGTVIAITGTAGSGVPALPTDATYITIAQISVVHAVTGIVTGNITDKRQFTAALGGVIPCDSTTEPSTGTVAPGQLAYRTDLGVYHSVNGGAWRQATPYRQSFVLGSAVASVVFSGIPNSILTATIRYSIRGDTASEVVSLLMRVNADSGASYFGTLTQVTNTTTTTASNAGGTSQQVGTVLAASAGAGQYGGGVIELSGLGSTSRKLNAVFRSQAWSQQSNSNIMSGGFMYNAVGQFTSYTLFLSAGNLAAGSTLFFEGWD